jgi:tRNA pseudouridine55 synthase
MLLLIDKPKGRTSHDVVDEVRDITGESKVGHGGTLDPNATGLLIVGITRAGTKQLGTFQTDAQKTYEAVITLGEETNTLDAVGDVVEMTDTDPIDRGKIESALESFLGRQEQVPPAYSAVRVDGERAYKKARNGDKPDVPPRIVEIDDISINDYSFPHLVITTTVSSGTYIRSLARDIGNELGCGAYLKNLRRLQVNNYTLEQAHSLADITSDNWQKFVIHNE